MSPSQPPQPASESWHPSEEIVAASRHIYELYGAYYKAQHEDALIDIQIADQLYEQAEGKPFDHEARGISERRKTDDYALKRSREELLAELSAPLSEAELARHRDGERWYQFFEQALQTEREHLPGLELRHQAHAEEKKLGRLLAQDPPPILTDLLGPVPRPGGRYRRDTLSDEPASLHGCWLHAAGAVVALRFGGGVDVTGEPLQGRAPEWGQSYVAQWPGMREATWAEDTIGVRVHVQNIMGLVASVQEGQSVNFEISWEKFRILRGRFGFFDISVQRGAGDPKSSTDFWNRGRYVFPPLNYSKSKGVR